MEDLRKADEIIAKMKKIWTPTKPAKIVRQEQQVSI